jgi:putative hydrolase of HD superfamily
MSRQIEAMVGFLFETDRLKSVARGTRLYSGERLENAAEHSWHLAVAVMVFQKLAAPNLQFDRAVRMAVVHYITEIEATDLFLRNDPILAKSNASHTLERLTSQLHAEVAADFRDIWADYQTGDSVEAQYVAALNRFLPLYSNLMNQGQAWKNTGVTSSLVKFKNQQVIQKALPDLWDLAERMIESSVRAGYLEP